MPHSGDIPAAANSCLVLSEEAAVDIDYAKIKRRCELAAQALGTLATIRLDARRRGQVEFRFSVFLETFINR